MTDDGSTTATANTAGSTTHGGTDGAATDEGGDGGETRRTGLHPAALFVSHLAVGVLSAAAGVVFGGWIAFETGYWHSFRTWIEGLGSDAAALTAGLLLVAVVVSLSVAVRSSRR